MVDRVRQRERNAVYLLHSTMRGLHLNSHSTGRCLEFSPASSRHCPPIPQTTMTLNRRHFTNTKRCGTALSFSPLHAAPPSHPTQSAHTHTHKLASPFPTFVSVERHMVTAIRFPRLKVAFHFTAVHKEVRLWQTEILSESSLFCA